MQCWFPQDLGWKHTNVLRRGQNYTNMRIILQRIWTKRPGFRPVWLLKKYNKYKKCTYQPEMKFNWQMKTDQVPRTSGRNVNGVWFNPSVCFWGPTSVLSLTHCRGLDKGKEMELWGSWSLFWPLREWPGSLKAWPAFCYFCFWWREGGSSKDRIYNFLWRAQLQVFFHIKYDAFTTRSPH